MKYNIWGGREKLAWNVSGTETEFANLWFLQVTYGSFDYTSLLYLTDYGVDFGGGRFIFIDPDSNRTVEPRAGTRHFV